MRMPAPFSNMPLALWVPGIAESGWIRSNRAGWETAAGQGCERYLALDGPTVQPGQPPRYCNEFYGVTCCSGNGSSVDCMFNHALTIVALPLSQINGSLNDPQVFGSIQALESCGLQVASAPDINRSLCIIPWSSCQDRVSRFHC
jgi:hypothetical protein